MKSGWKPSRTVEFHTYAAEEAGLLGSQDIAMAYQKAGKKVYSMMQLGKERMGKERERERKEKDNKRKKEKEKRKRKKNRKKRQKNILWSRKHDQNKRNHILY